LQQDFGDDHTGPQIVEQLLLAHDPVLIVDQVKRQIEHPGLQGKLLSTETKGAGVPVELERREGVDV
jgi:hypothetical protein